MKRSEIRGLGLNELPGFRCASSGLRGPVTGQMSYNYS